MPESASNSATGHSRIIQKVFIKAGLHEDGAESKPGLGPIQTHVRSGVHQIKDREWMREPEQLIASMSSHMMLELSAVAAEFIL